MANDEIQRRKADHIELAASGISDFKERSTLLESVQLVHQSLPELSINEIDLSTKFLGKILAAPILITGMTGGTAEARTINRDLAAAAEMSGIAFGLGSQRALADNADLLSTYEVRDIAPELLLIGNIGAIQAQDYGVDGVAKLAEQVGADAMAVHLNPAQERIQHNGDRDFRGAAEMIATLNAELGIPVIVKETGCGVSKQVADRLVAMGVKNVDVSGAGGTSWVAVERHRAHEGSAQQSLGDELWDWGLPTAVSVHSCVSAGLNVVASGGLRTGYDIARAIALGATLGGLAAPALRAQRAGGQEGVYAFLESLKHSLQTILLLTGCRTPKDLQNAPKHIQEPLRSWIQDLSPGLADNT